MFQKFQIAYNIIIRWIFIFASHFQRHAYLKTLNNKIKTTMQSVYDLPILQNRHNLIKLGLFFVQSVGIINLIK